MIHSYRNKNLYIKFTLCFLSKTRLVKICILINTCCGGQVLRSRIGIPICFCFVFIIDDPHRRTFITHKNSPRFIVNGVLILKPI